MPKDANGDELQVGDVVTVRFTVENILFPIEEGTNVRLKAADEVQGEFQPRLSINSGFTTKEA